MKNNKLFWGLFFIMSAVFIFISGLGYCKSFNFMSLTLTTLLIVIIIKSIKKINFTGIFFPLAFIGIIFSNQLGISSITPWPILTIALFLNIGFNFLFGKHHFNWFHHKDKIRFNNSEEINDNYISISSSFSSSIKYITSDDFLHGNVYCSFSSLKLYFYDAVMKNDNASIDLSISFATVDLYIPKGWNVIITSDPTLGSISEKNKHDTVYTNTLTINGDISLSSLNIYYL